MFFQPEESLGNAGRHNPVDNHAGQINFHTICPKVLGNDQISLANHIDEADGVGQGPFFQQIDDGIAKVRQGYDCSLGQHELAECLKRGQANADCRFILPFGDSLIGGPEYFRNIGAK